mmetsp:Transcript_22188/g.27120  ORF Transcript_22188/g.27120 Transcript_22188/m.27120 type:complete len:554 (-) Transcript_22188:143-1804(-)|eukprot:CAMPEP_0204828854 /NCGR_PEP_ID=MMETSP1346-20131115/6781_1 /ASSEMBLY_ACC=CAM_ASM_000771 /TAXON_ID=215587 /ORGANISM="Aplanochytrium stocchinoi, Strain GSBS06" /LENGTH=553 /DNA_ID=CAMNT_0051958201 /DNA_START=144 /DNA_END=1808 /DNA_ORIENTATION=-
MAEVSESRIESSASKALWRLPRTRLLSRKCLVHPFMLELSQGTLAPSTFKCYVAQDAYFLKAFRDAYSAGKQSAQKIEIKSLSERVAKSFGEFEAAVDYELKLHAKYARELGICLESTSPLPATTGYVNFLKEAWNNADATLNIIQILVAMVPCNRLYQWLGSTLEKGGAKETSGEYRSWIEEYSSQEFRNHTEKIESLLDSLCVKVLSEIKSQEIISSWLSELGDAYIQAMEHELAFFEQQPGMQEAYAKLNESTKNENPFLAISDLIPPRILIVAGSDSGGGAGIQADIKAASALGAFSTTAVAALTAQNSRGVQGIFPIPIDFVKQQMESVLLDFGTDVIKTGMLATKEIVTGVATQLKSEHSPIERWRRMMVCDPVMVSTSGHVLLEDSAIESVKRELFPLSTIVTPNIPEASLLLGNRKIEDIQSMKDAARDLCAMGPQWVYIKGGHLKNLGKANSGDEVKAIDILCNGRTGECKEYISPMIETGNTHGTGCTLASSISALLARGHTVEEAVASAKDYVSGAIKASVHLQLGSGPQGPLNHHWQNYKW